jgi:hypothetical protein
MEIVKKLTAVMEEVGGVAKREKNQAQGFNFRGIDSVVNAVSPALRKHGVIVIPTILSCDYDTVLIGKNQTAMGHVRVTVAYTFTAGDGSSIVATVAAESMDSGDKATAKAMSVAFRTALLQALCLPTDDIDPDAQSYERAEGVRSPVKASAAPVKPMKPEVGPMASKGQLIYIESRLKKVHGDKWRAEYAKITKTPFEQLSTAEAIKVVQSLSTAAVDLPEEEPF